MAPRIFNPMDPLGIYEPPPSPPRPRKARPAPRYDHFYYDDTPLWGMPDTRPTATRTFRPMTPAPSPSMVSLMYSSSNSSVPSSPSPSTPAAASSAFSMPALERQRPRSLRTVSPSIVAPGARQSPSTASSASSIPYMPQLPRQRNIDLAPSSSGREGTDIDARLPSETPEQPPMWDPGMFPDTRRREVGSQGRPWPAAPPAHPPPVAAPGSDARMNLPGLPPATPLTTEQRIQNWQSYHLPGIAYDPRNPAPDFPILRPRARRWDEISIASMGSNWTSVSSMELRREMAMQREMQLQREIEASEGLPDEEPTVEDVLAYADGLAGPPGSDSDGASTIPSLLRTPPNPTVHSGSEPVWAVHSAPHRRQATVSLPVIEEDPLGAPCQPWWQTAGPCPAASTASTPLLFRGI